MKAPRSSPCLVLLVCFMPILVKGDATSDLAAVQEAFFRWLEQKSPLYLSTLVGNKDFNDRLTNLSTTVFYPQLVAAQEFLNTARTIDRRQLSRQQQYNYDILVNALETFESNYVWRHYGALSPVTFLDAFYLDMDHIVSITPFDTKADFDNYIARLEAWPIQIDQMMERMDKAIEMNTTLHNMSVRAIPGQLSAVISTEPQDSPLYRPFTTTLDTLQVTQAERADMRSRALDALETMRSALGRLKTYFEETYIPHTRSTYGVHGLPAGRDYYRACLQWHLSVDMSPEQVHQTGLREVDRITQRMRQVMTKEGFTGSISEYYNQLNADPRFQMNTREEILERYDNIIHDRIEPKLSQVFRDIPPNSIVVKPTPYDSPAGYSPSSEDGSRPGTFYANVIRPNDTKKFTMVSLSLHESLPGHHLQHVFQLKADLPNSRRYFDIYFYYDIPYKFPFYTAFLEGWALYAEYLGEEMGVYADDYEMMGRYGREMYRACRLVVDTGLHYFAWTRDRAIRYLSERTPFAQAKVVLEIDRYITWPGQACAYKIGELKIKELRQKAAKDLGTKFDVRDFHSVVLANGRAPLNVLETIVNDYIADQTGAAPAVHSLSGTRSGTCVLLASLLLALLTH